MHIIKSVGVLSCAKIFAIVHFAIGLIFVPFFLLMAMVGAFAGPKAGNPFPAAVAIVLAVFMPFFYGVLGFIMGAIGAWIYNLASSWLGGIELDLQPPAATVVATSTYSGMD
jgi:small-conductance mechanosensitive channel